MVARRPVAGTARRTRAPAAASFQNHRRISRRTDARGAERVRHCRGLRIQRTLFCEAVSRANQSVDRTVPEVRADFDGSRLSTADGAAAEGNRVSIGIPPTLEFLRRIPSGDGRNPWTFQGGTLVKAHTFHLKGSASTEHTTPE